MNTEQEIRAKALEITVRTIAAMPEKWLDNIIADNKDITTEQFVISLSKAYEIHIKG